VNPRAIVKKLIPKSLFRAVEPYGHLLEAVFYNLINGFPASSFKVIGVTGTNGKTTTSFLIHRMMLESGYKVGLMTTVAYGAGDNIKPQIHHMTNVAVPELMKRLKWLKGQGIEWLILETTSHALAQNRVWGIPYSVAVMTNLTHEHLDYHGTFENYRSAKVKLFKKAAANRKGLRMGIVNADDDSAEYFLKAVPNIISYGVKKGELMAKNIHASSNGSKFQIYSSVNDHRNMELTVNLPGSFNVYNALAAAGIAALKAVEGRMTSLNEGQPFSVIVDFAHTPDSFEKLFKDIRPVIKGKLIVMFGSAGRRDEAKRAVQGSLAGKYADEVVITEEDDRDIDGMEIMNQIAEGAEKNGKVRDRDLFLVHNRTEAIKFALSRAKTQDDTVLLLGKGHEKTIERADGEHPWDEIGITKKLLKN
jgi:UDP-N-acetylmuramoyl-L-alanyl-D-glutamate--2,6-diaminopimelate ligase